MHPKAKLQNAPTFTRNVSHSHVWLLLVIKIKTYTYQLCKWQSANTNILIGRCQLSAKQPIIGRYRYRLSADYRCISINNTVNRNSLTIAQVDLAGLVQFEYIWLMEFRRNFVLGRCSNSLAAFCFTCCIQLIRYCIKHFLINCGCLSGCY